MINNIHKFIGVVDQKTGLTASMTVEHFLRTFFTSDWKYLPLSNIIRTNDLENLKDLILDLSFDSRALALRCFLYFHIVNKGYIITIYKELLNYV